MLIKCIFQNVLFYTEQLISLKKIYKYKAHTNMTNENKYKLNTNHKKINIILWTRKIQFHYELTSFLT